MTTIEIPGWQGMGVACPQGLGLNGWMGVINSADYFLGCDSIGQHMAYALKKPSTVVIGSTFPENFLIQILLDLLLLIMEKEEDGIVQ